MKIKIKIKIYKNKLKKQQKKKDILFFKNNEKHKNGMNLNNI